MSLLNAIQGIPTAQTGNSVQTYILADDATMTTQFALLKAGKVGTAGSLTGVSLRMGDYGVVKSTDSAGNVTLRRVNGSPYAIDSTYGLIDHFGSLGGTKSRTVSVNLGAGALKSNTSIHAAVTLPTANSATGIHAAITLTGASQTITTGITNPSGRLPSITGTAAGMAGPVTLAGLDLNGNAASVTLYLSGTTTVRAALTDLPYGLNTVTSIVVPPLTNAGDTVQIGVGDLVTVSSITNPDIPQAVLIHGTAAGIAGNVNVLGLDVEGTQILDTIAANGTTAVNGVKAFKSVTSFSVPNLTTAGDTISIGTSNILGLPYRMDHDAVIATQFGTVREATRPTITYDGTNVSGNTVLLNSALDGSHTVIVDFIRSDAPLEFDRN